jgi:Secretion system C-terminal sorting domain
MIMKTLKLFIQLTILLLISNNSFGQLYAKNADIYVADNYLFVTGNVNLDTAGNIFLRNESQLLQGGTVASTNVGVGKLSVFQEGTANNFHYNFWCSPVGNANATVGNSDFSIATELYRPTALTTSTNVGILPLTNKNGVSTNTSLDVSQRWIWKYVNSNIYSLNAGGWISVYNGTVTPGLGFTMKGVSGSDNTTIISVQNNPGNNQRYDFKGKPNDGDITTNLAANSNTLIGNPYPSAINLSSFLNNATNSTGVAYFYIQNTGPTTDSHFVTSYQAGYQAYTPGAGGTIGVIAASTFSMYDGAGVPAGAATYTGLTYQRYFTPIGQGFMIRGSAVGGDVTMKNAYRVFKKEAAANFSEFSKNGNAIQAIPSFLPETPNVAGFDYTTVSTLPSPQIRFNTTIDDVLSNEMVLTFDPEATDGVDHAKDAFTPNEFNAKDIAFKIDNNPYIISSIQFNEDKVLPLLFRNASSETNYKIKVKEILNFTGAQNVYLHDKVSGNYFDVLNGIANVTLPAGNNGTRYEITFKNGALATNQNSIQEFTVVQNNKEQQLSISNPSLLDLKEVSLYDVSGKLIFSKSKLTKEVNYQFSTSGLSEGVYIVNMLLADNTKKSQKISIFAVR